MKKDMYADYSQRVKKIKPWTSLEWYNRYSLFSASLSLAFPEMAAEHYLTCFHRTILNQQLIRGEENPELSVPVHWEGPYDEMRKLIDAGPVVICTFHTGSYRFINQYLLQQFHIQMALLVSDDFVRTEDRLFQDHRQKLKLRPGVNLTTISANQKSSALQILRALNRGRSILAYIDGNMGAESINTKYDPRVEMEFFGLPIRVRVGLATLAHRAQVPLICVLARRGINYENFFQITRIWADPKAWDSDSQRFAGQATKDMYRDLERMLRQEPWQWDMWFYFHRFLL